MNNAPAGIDRTEVTDDLPQELERRLVLRLLAYWRSVLNGRAFPSFAEIDPGRIADIWPHCFVVELAGERREPVFRAFGRDLAMHANASLIGRRVAEAPTDSLLAVASAQVAEVLDKGVPVSRGGGYPGTNRSTILYRSILLPMSDDGKSINGLLGAVNCREVPQG